MEQQLEVPLREAIAFLEARYRDIQKRIAAVRGDVL
jgi:hypothetical protein